MLTLAKPKLQRPVIPRTTIRHLLTVGLLLCSAGCISALAADNGEEMARWYQVEILIFANQRERHNGELWRKDIELAYPLKWVALKHPDPPERQPSAAATTEPGSSGSDEDKSSRLTLPTLYDTLPGLDRFEHRSPPLPEPMQQEPGTDPAAPIPTALNPAALTGDADPANVDPAMADSAMADPEMADPEMADPEMADPEMADPGLDENLMQSLEPVPVDLERQPWYLLPDNMHALQSEAKAIQRSSNYRLLYHQAWRQPVVDQPQAPSILISGGDSYGGHFELEGSISLSVSRYLHLGTNLWFTRFTHNYGQDRDSWPELPPRPDTYQHRAMNSPANEQLPAWQKVSTLNDEYDKILSTPFIAQRISTIVQQRRMRSGELHYIDHPHIGIVVLCTPYDVPAKPEQPVPPPAPLVRPIGANQ